MPCRETAAGRQHAVLCCCSLAAYPTADVEAQTLDPQDQFEWNAAGHETVEAYKGAADTPSRTRPSDFWAAESTQPSDFIHDVSAPDEPGNPTVYLPGLDSLSAAHLTAASKSPSPPCVHFEDLDADDRSIADKSEKTACSDAGSECSAEASKNSARSRWITKVFGQQHCAALDGVGRSVLDAARVHSGATIAVVIPKSVRKEDRPTAEVAETYGLCHPIDVPGWIELRDQSAMGLLQPLQKKHKDEDEESPRSAICSRHPARHGHGHRHRNDKHVSKNPLRSDEVLIEHGQAKMLCQARFQAVSLLVDCAGSNLSEDDRLTLHRAPQNECGDVLSSLLPGFRLWPVHDQLVNRCLIFNVASGRFSGSFLSCLRLGRGWAFLDIMRLHYGEEMAFLMAWHQNYLHMLLPFALCMIPFICMDQDPELLKGSKANFVHLLVVQTMLTIVLGATITEVWKERAFLLVHRWQMHGENVTRWRTLVNALLYREKVKGQTEQRDTSPKVSVRRASMPMAPLQALPKSSVKLPRQNRADERGDVIKRVSFGAEVNDRPARSSIVSSDSVRSATSTYSKGLAAQMTMTSQRTNADACMEACGWRTSAPDQKSRCHWCSILFEIISQVPLKNILKVLLLIPLIFMEWLIIAMFFTVIVWFEMWVIFDWGGCRALNMEKGKEEWTCLGADMGGRGLLGTVVGATPSIMEGAFFELILAISKLMAGFIISMFTFTTRERKDFAYISLVFVLEICGKVGFIAVLAIGFVPVWNNMGTSCTHMVDYYILGENSLACMKLDIPYKVRLKMLESAMKGPMLVSGLVGILVKTVIPMILEAWRRCSAREKPGGGCCACCCRFVVGRVILAPADFLLRVASLIFQVDCGAVGGLRLICLWPPSLDVPKLKAAAQEETPHIRTYGFGMLNGAAEAVSPDAFEEAKENSQKSKENRMRLRLWTALMEGDRREYEPFDEYLELLLHLLWTMCFAVVWPLGCLWAFANQFLEYRFDCVKLLMVRRRRFPNSRHMSVAWVPFFTEIVSSVAIFVNCVILLIPYRMMSRDLPEDIPVVDFSHGLSLDSNTPRLMLSLLVLLIFFSLFRRIAVCITKKILWRKETNGKGEHVTLSRLSGRLRHDFGSLDESLCAAKWQMESFGTVQTISSMSHSQQDDDSLVVRGPQTLSACSSSDEAD